MGNDGEAKRKITAWALALCVFPLANAGLNHLVLETSWPLFLDSIFTALSAAAFGLLPGLATAVLTNGAIELFNGFPGTHFPFAICGMATAWIVAHAVKKGRFDTSLQAAAVLLAVALANALLGALVAVFVFGGYTDVNIDILVSGFRSALGNIFSAAFLGRLPTNIVDKGIAVVIPFLLRKAWGASGRMRPNESV